MQPQKRGDSFDRLANIPDTFADGYFVGWTVKCQLRTAQHGKLIAELECAWVDPATTRILTVRDLDTKDWPLGDAEMDIQFTRTQDGYVRSTSTIAFTITKDITRAQP